MILDSKTLSNLFYRIRFSIRSRSSTWKMRTLSDWEVRTWNLGQSCYWLISDTVDDDSQLQNAQIIYELKVEAQCSSFSQCRSLYGFLNSLFICDHFGSKLWLPSFPSFCAPASEVLVLFHLKLSKGPFLERAINLDLQISLGCDSEPTDLLRYLVFTEK